MKVWTHERGAARGKMRTLKAVIFVAAAALVFASSMSSPIEFVLAAAAEKMSVSQAKRAIARTAGIELPTAAVEVEKEGISVIGSEATVEAKVRTAFRLRRAEKGDWEVAEVRLGAGRWEDVALLSRALDREKGARARAELTTLRVALEAFRRERGHYPAGSDARTLADNLSPRYLSQVIRLDPWQQPYAYTGTLSSYALRSAGADRELGTADDILPVAGG